MTTVEKEAKTPRAFLTFPRERRQPRIIKWEGSFLQLADGNRYLDLTAGLTGFAILGGGVEEIIKAITSQVSINPHADYKYFEEPLRDELARLVLPASAGNLDRVLFAGGSGSEACEMAIQLSFQVHREQGSTAKSWAIATRQSYHGSTTGALSVGERPNLEFYSPILPQNRLRIPECNFQKNALDGESPADYSRRAADMLEAAILSVGPEKVSCFVGETMLGGLVGDVPATDGYWKRIKDICTRYNVHLILDEVWCGGGVTGKLNCFEWEAIEPDFVFTGKTIAAGYAPISLVLTSSFFEDVIKNGSGRLEMSCTFQGHLVGCAAAIATQQLIRSNNLLNRAQCLGDATRKTLSEELKNNPFIVDVRGRGIRNSLAYQCPEPHLFGQQIAHIMRDKFKILISGKWHRLSLTHSMLINDQVLETALMKLIETIQDVSSSWTESYYNKLSRRNFF